MAVSASIGRQKTVNELVRKAYQYAGLKSIAQSPSAVEYQYGRDTLEDILDAIEADGHVQARAMTFHTLTLVADQQAYTLPTTILQLLDVAMYKDANASETHVQKVGQAEWQLIPTKTSTGRPIKFYGARDGEATVVSLWPIPDTADEVIFRVQRKFSDTDSGNATIDLQNYWIQYLKVELARQLAFSQSLHDVAQALMGEAMIKLKECKAKSRPKHNAVAHLNHRGGGGYPN